MDFLRGVDAVLNGSGAGPFDWVAAAETAKAGVDPGSTELSGEAEAAYATALREFREPVRAATGVDGALPDTLAVLDRHHWIDAQVATCRRVTARDRERDESLVAALGAVVGAERLGDSLSLVAGSTPGRYDRQFPLAFADGVADEVHLVHANVERLAGEVDAEPTRVRQWAVAHELVHAAELSAAPWLPAYLAERVRALVRRFEEAAGPPEALGDAPEVEQVQRALVVAEGYATLALARAFDGGYAALHREVHAVRWDGGVAPDLARDLLGVDPGPGLYDRGRQFLVAVVDARGFAAADAVLADPDALPTAGELREPQCWLDRVDP